MDMTEELPGAAARSHVFLHPGHEVAERRSWAVIVLCATMMLLEIGGGIAFGSIALIADGLHMSTHSGALLLAALAYRYARAACARPEVLVRHRQAGRSGGVHQCRGAGADRGADRV